MKDHVTVKEVITDPIVDKHPYKDPITDPVTIPENIVTDPAGFAPDPSTGAQPYVLATPHHAPTSTIAPQMGMPSAAQLATTPLRDLRTMFYHDRLHTLLWQKAWVCKRVADKW